MHYASSPRRSRACSVVRSRVRHSSAIASGPVAETTRRSSRRRRGGTLADAVARSRRRPMPLAARSADGPRTASSGGAAPPSQDGLGPHHAYAVGRSRRRPTPSRRGLCWWAGLVCQWQVALPRVESAKCAHPRGRGDSSPSPRRRVVHRTQSRRAKDKGEGSVRTTKPAPSEYPHATALGRFERRDKTRTFCLRA